MSKKLLVLFIALLIGATAVVFMARFSMPGDALYGVKTGVLESLQYPQKGSDVTSLSNSVILFENRLSETQELIVKQVLSTSSAQAIEIRLADQVKTFRENATTEDVDVSSALSRAVTVESAVRAIDALTYKEVPDSIQAEFGDIAENASDVQMELRNRLVAAGTTTVTMYFNEQVSDISKMLEAEVVTERSVADIATYIEKASQAFAEGRFDRAVAYINEAKKAANLRIYLQLPILDSAPEPDMTGEG